MVGKNIRKQKYQQQPAIIPQGAIPWGKEALREEVGVQKTAQFLGELSRSKWSQLIWEDKHTLCFKPQATCIAVDFTGALRV